MGNYITLFKIDKGSLYFHKKENKYYWYTATGYVEVDVKITSIYLSELTRDIEYYVVLDYNNSNSNLVKQNFYIFSKYYVFNTSENLFDNDVRFAKYTLSYNMHIFDIYIAYVYKMN